MSDEEKAAGRIFGWLTPKKGQNIKHRPKFKASEFDFSKYIVNPKDQFKAWKKKKEGNND